jgi:Flp pilus assembly protein TadG
MFDRFWALTRLRALWVCQHGAAALEFAFALPILIVIMCGTLDLGMLLFADVLIEGAVRDTSRLGITGYAPTGEDRDTLILDALKKDTLGLIDISKATITHKVYDTFADVGQPEPYDDANGNGQYDLGEDYTDVNGNGQWDADMGVAGLGGSGDIVLYTVTYPWTSWTHLIDPLFGSDGTITLKASTVVRNEPYGGTSVTGGAS